MRSLPPALSAQRFRILNSASFGYSQPERTLVLVSAESPRTLGVQRFDARGHLLDPNGPVTALVTLNHRDPGPDGAPQAGIFLSVDRYSVVLRLSMAIQYDLEMNAATVTLLRQSLV